MPVSHAFHSPLMTPVVEPFERIASGVPFQPPRIPIISTLTGALARGGDLASPAYWSRQLREPVRFAAALRTLDGMGVKAVIEVGPKAALIGMHRRTVGDLAALRLSSLRPTGDDWRQVLGSLSALWVRGHDVPPAGAAGASLRWHAPTYAFGGRRYWLEQAIVEEHASNGESGHSALPAPNRASVTERLQALLGELLNVPASSLDARAPLADMGADSFILIEGMQRVRREFGLTISPRDVFSKLETIHALAAHIEAHTPSPAATAPVLPAAPAVDGAPVDGAAPAEAQGGAPTLTARQVQHIGRLSERYTQRTRGSRQRKTESDHLADIRSSAGYRPSYPRAARELWMATRDMCYPIVATRSQGSRFWDVDDNEYVDFCMGFGVHLFGHRPPWLIAAYEEQLRRGVHIGPQSAHATEVAARIKALTGVERVCFCSSGTDAVMTAVRLCRAAVGRPKIAAFSGSYHGSFDGVLGTIPMTLGSPPGIEHDLIVLEYGHPSALETLRKHAGEIAGVLVEPVQSRRPDLQPREFLRELRAVTREHGMALIFDEVLLGFRIAQGGAQAWFGIEADIVTYGKIIGGGMPMGVVAGKREFLDRVDGGAWRYDDGSTPREEPVWFAGTFNKNPLGMAASLATLEHLAEQGPSLQEGLNRRTSGLAAGLNAWFGEQGAPIEVVHFGSLFRFRAARSLDLLFHHLVERGLYVWEGRSLFLSTAHSDDDVQRLVDGVKDAVGELRAGGVLPERPPVAIAPAAPSAPVVIRPHPNPQAALRLFCFPYAGGSSTVYRRWPTQLPFKVELSMVQLPGRDERRGEPSMVDFEALVSSLTLGLLPHVRQPFAFFGHSMGALLAYEVARRLHEQHGIDPRLLVVSGEAAPHLLRPAAPTLDDETLIGLLARYGTPRGADEGPGLPRTASADPARRSRGLHQLPARRFMAARLSHRRLRRDAGSAGGDEGARRLDGSDQLRELGDAHAPRRSLLHPERGRSAAPDPPAPPRRGDRGVQPRRARAHPGRSLDARPD